ncbi:Aste57867_12997 [Aphanomyces stellatus]|uniref:Aste57867_12997 protein n=1 Tax=Aphanomyces stellatus TaxID=120398 RepID=A0A485KX11_9STRA|nr:hypothetical protein As57867_012949 [Aphanomyces stellatus]VFT89843.1 Aste57867_12997 [Aphanomyces stellatus]
MEVDQASLERMYDSDTSSNLGQGIDTPQEEMGESSFSDAATPFSSSSPKTNDRDMSWLRRLERDMDKKLILDADKINERIQRRKAQEDEMQQSLASFTLSARQSKSSNSVQSSSSKSNDSMMEAVAAMAATEATRPFMDEWKEAFTEDGKKYYYNRRTRESSWVVPENAIVVNRSIDLMPSASSLPSATATTTTTTLAATAVQVEDDARSTEHDADVVAASSMTQANKVMYCMFCGKQCRVWELMQHMSSCVILLANKEQRTAMYEEAVDIMGELFAKQTVEVETQTSDKYLHYASVYSVHATDDENEDDSSRDPLALLKRRRRHTVHPTTPSRVVALESHIDNDDDDDDVRQLNVDVDTQLSLLRLKRTTEAATSLRGTSEQCRYCHRVFAEGRLTKHEAVCPRVFGSDPLAWSSSSSGSTKKDSSSITMGPFKKKDRPSSSSTKKAAPPAGVTMSKANGLVGSFKDHQAMLVTCPSCQRRFAPAGAQQHIAICQHVENKPKKFNKSYAVAG